MSRTFAAVALCLGALSSTPSSAQTEVIVRQGDTIEWHQVSGGQHRVKFGGTVSGVDLTSVDEIKKILADFDPSLPDNGEPLPVPGNPRLLKATVQPAAAADATFIFTCGNHPSLMLSIPFRVEAAPAGAAPQVHRIEGVAGMHWKLQPGNKHIDTTP